MGFQVCIPWILSAILRGRATLVAVGGHELLRGRNDRSARCHPTGLEGETAF